MRVLKCAKCASPLKKVTVNLDYNLPLQFLVCNNCRYLHELDVDKAKNRLKNETGGWARWLKEHLGRYIVTLKLIPFSSKKLIVLDVGAAPGYLARMIQQLFQYDVYALDRHAMPFLDFQSYVDAMKRHGVIVKDCDVDKDRFPFLDETFDVVLSTEVVEHLYKPEHALNEINRVMKANGILILSTVNFLRASNRVKVMLGKPTTFHGVKEYTLEELKKLLKNTNFLVKRVVFSDWEEQKLIIEVLQSPRLPISSVFWTIVKYCLARLKPSLCSYVFVLAIKN